MTNRSNSGQYVPKLSRIISYSAIPLLAEEGWRDSLIEAGAPGAKREPDRAKPQSVVSSAGAVRRSDAPRLRLRYARRIHPSSARRGISQVFQTPHSVILR